MPTEFYIATSHEDIDPSAQPNTRHIYGEFTPHPAAFIRREGESDDDFDKRSAAGVDHDRPQETDDSCLERARASFDQLVMGYGRAQVHVSATHAEAVRDGRLPADAKPAYDPRTFELLAVVA